MTIVPESWIRGRLSRRVVIASLATLASVAAASGFLAISSERTVILERIDAQGASLSHAVAIGCTEALLLGDYPVLETLAADLANEKNDVRCVIIRKDDGRVVAEAPRGASADPRLAAECRLYSHPITAGLGSDDVKGEVTLAISTRGSDLVFAARVRSLLAQTLAAFASLGFLLTFLLRRLVGEPLAKLDERAEALGRGALDEPIELPKAKDELARLAGTLERMRLNLKASYEEISSQNERLRELDRMKDEFLANVTHEFKTPLNGILGIGAAIQEGAYGEMPEAMRSPFSMIEESAERLLRMAEQILTLSRFESSEAKSGARDIDLAEYVERLVGPLEHEFRSRGLARLVDVESGLTLRTDPDLLDHVLSNLVANALKFTAAGHVRIAARPVGGDAVAIAVEDTGIGIPRAMHEKVFDRFQQGFASERRRYEGSGLGLAIVRRCVEAIGGRVLLDSEPGRGSTFTVLLPRDPETAIGDGHVALCREAGSLPAPAAAPPAAAGGGPAASERKGEEPAAPLAAANAEEFRDATVLVVDDDAINREVVASRLRAHFRVVEAADGHQCLLRIEDESPDIVLLDLMMPGMSGFDVLTELARRQAESPLPVIVLSARNASSSVARALGLGAVDYVTKPFNRDELVARVRTHLALRKREIELSIALSNLRDALEKANEGSRTKGEFLATMSHEIRTPMNGVVGMTTLLLDTNLDAEQREYAEIVKTSAESLMAVINDILDFSKIEAGKLSIQECEMDLREEVERAVELVAGLAQRKGLELLYEFDHGTPAAVLGDPLRLRQVLLNLLGNAIKFTARGEVALRIGPSILKGNGHLVRFTVADTGIGIDEESGRRLFQPFTQADASTTRRFGGTGLGLAISKQLVELMGGEIGFESAPGRGSTFWFTVRFGASAQAAPAESAGQRLRGLRALVADDNAANRRIIASQLASWGMTATLCDDGESALAAARRAGGGSSGAPFDAILLDLLMPGMDGLETAREIRKIAWARGVPIILLSSSTVPGLAESCRTAGIAAWLTKPARPARLRAALLEALPGRDAEPAAEGEPRFPEPAA